jgi:putative DNA primase/helicase
LAPVGYDPNAPRPLFARFIEQIFDGDRELMGFVQRLLGYCLSGDITEQILPIFHGEGANGKSVLLDLVCGLMGDYAGLAPPHLLTLKQYADHPTEIADLFGKRLVVASETEEDATLRVQLVKRLTGDARLKGRFMRRDYFEYDRTHKTVLATNNRPRISEGTEAVWRRVRLIPFGVVVPEGERDLHLLAKLREEGSGVLAWLVRGCIDWRGQGLGQPRVVEVATNDYRRDESHVERFLDECCSFDENPSTSQLLTEWSRLSTAYREWCTNERVRPISDLKLGQRLDAGGVQSDTQRVGGRPAKVRRGIRLISDEGIA